MEERAEPERHATVSEPDASADSAEPESRFSLTTLPAEVLDIIVGHSRASELLVLGCVSKALFSELVGADHVWQPLFKTRFAPVVHRLYRGETPQPAVGKSWKQHYRAFSKGWMTAAAHGAVLITIYGRVHDVTDCASPTQLEAPPNVHSSPVLYAASSNLRVSGPRARRLGGAPG